MNIIVHYPKTQQGMQNLHNKIAIVHAEMVTKYLQKLSCPLEQKLRIVKEIQSKI